MCLIIYYYYPYYYNDDHVRSSAFVFSFFFVRIHLHALSYHFSTLIFRLFLFPIWIISSLGPAHQFKFFFSIILFRS